MKAARREKAASNRARGPEGRWLLLVQQLPARPSNARVKTWRRLQQLGAVPLKNAVYALPNSPEAREDFEWLKAEIVAMKGQAMVFAADAIDPGHEKEIIRAFRVAREQDFKAMRLGIEKMVRGVAGKGRLRDSQLRRARRAARGFRDRLTEIESIDFFSADSRDEALAALTGLERRLANGRVPPAGSEMPRVRSEAFQARVWVTRPRPGIDRIASAWLVRRFVDARARFAFAAERNVVPKGAVPFDMYNVEFSHRGDLCTFEVLADRFGVGDTAVRRIGEIVHDVDLKDNRFQPPEASTLAALVEGLRQAYSDDGALLEQGIAVFEGLYRSFQRRNHGPARKRRISERRR